MSYLLNLQQQAQHLLKMYYTLPQRYGTAFHLSPPVTDARELVLENKDSDILEEQNSWEKLQPDIQAEIKTLREADPYLLWHLSQGEAQVHRLIHIQAGEKRTVQLQGSGIFWLVVEAGAEVEIQDVLFNAPLAIRRLFIWQEQSSSVKLTAIRGRIKFLTERCQVFLRGAKAETQLIHLAYGSSGEQNDIEVSVYHQAAHTQSNLQFRAAAQTKHVAMYRGLIDIDQQAVGSVGYQQGRGLLLGSRAVIDMLPQLQIRTNDVRCSHGVTTTHIDEAMLFYARSRGLSELEARQLALHGFYHHHLAIPEVLNTVLEQLYA